MLNVLRGKAAGYLLAVAGVVVATALLVPARGQINTTTIALVLLLVVLFVAALRGSGPALLASVLGMFCLNFFFLPPVGTFRISAPENWVALAAYLITAVTAGQLSARAEQRAEEAEAGRREIERLYEELREAFGRASHAEALRQSEKLKSALLDAVTHDIRTPLTSIKASVTTLLDEFQGKTGDEPPVVLDAGARREMLEVINEESDRLNRFVEGLVELARIEAGALTLRRRWGAVDDIIAATLRRADTLLRGRRVLVEIEREMPVVRVDSRAVAEVIYTLLDNAAKYSPAGRDVRIAARRTDAETMEVAVEDEGRGVPVNLRERIFDKFFRAMRDGDAGGADQPAGTGMGLAIAKGIVEAHGGRIRVEDGSGGVGSRFMFTLPVGDDEERDEG